MSSQELLKELERLKAENAQLKTAQNEGKISLRVSESGYVEVFGITGKGRFSNSNTPDGWNQLLAMQDKLRAFIATNKSVCDSKLSSYRATQNSKAVG